MNIIHGKLAGFGEFRVLVLPKLPPDRESGNFCIIWDDETPSGVALIMVNKVVVTLGAEGALLLTGSMMTQQVPSFAVKPVDTTGAGDAFNGALAVALARGMALSEAVRYANATGALTVTRTGAQPSLPTSDEVEQFLSERG